MLKDIGKKMHDLRCVHGDPWAGRYCVRCMDDRLEQEKARERGQQAMRDLLVWWFCHGVDDVDAFLFDIHGMWDREALKRRLLVPEDE